MQRNAATTFGALLRQWREEAGLSQEELAERAGLTGKAIGALERGERRHPYPATVQALANALGLDAADRLAFIAAAPKRLGMAFTEAHPGVSTPFPLPPAALIGREQDVATIQHLLMHGGVRLLTLTGPGGVGKTRLALEAAAPLREEFADGVVFAPLASVRDPALVVAALAGSLGLREGGGQPLEVIVPANLRAKSLLLVLDNFEHLLAAAPLVGMLLGTCPHLSVLVTSRSPLRLRAEQEYPVAPLAVPGPDQGTSVDRIGASPAVQVFVQRAQAAVPSFALTEENAQAVAAICRRLDGLPLALELAAARVKLLAPTALLTRLDHKLTLLRDGPVDLPERHRTMGAAIAWSYDLLRPQEQALANHLAVFSGGWTLEAAEAVCARALGWEAGDVVAGLGSLLDKNLIGNQDDANGRRRMGMLETIREYAWERLVESGAAADAQRTHAYAYLGLGEQAETHLMSAGRDDWLERLGREHDNLRAVLHWSLMEDGELEVGLRLAGVLKWYWFIGGFLTEGREYLEAALARAALLPDGPSGVSIPVRAQALYSAGSLAWIQGDFEAAQTQLEMSLALWQGTGDRRRAAYALGELGLVCAGRGDPLRGSLLCSEALTRLREVGDRWGEGQTLSTAAHVALLQGDLETARELLEQSLALLVVERDAWGQACILNMLGNVALGDGDPSAADSLFRESETLSRSVRSNWNLAWVLNGIAAVALLAGEHRRAKLACQESYVLSRDLGNLDSVALSLAGLAAIAMARGHVTRAARLFSTADTLTTWDSPFQAPYRYVFADYRAQVRERLAEVSVARAWAAGRAMTAEAVMAEAVEG